MKCHPFSNTSFAIYSFFFLFYAIIGAYAGERKILVSSKKFECIIENMAEYRKMYSDPEERILIFIDHCPSNSPSMSELSRLTVATRGAPDCQSCSNESEEQAVFNISLNEIECIVQRSLHLQHDQISELFDLRAARDEC